MLIRTGFKGNRKIRGIKPLLYLGHAAVVGFGLNMYCQRHRGGRLYSGDPLSVEPRLRMDR